MKTPREYLRVYVWEAPVRLFHWLNAASLLVLCVTGFLIGHPLALMTSGDASSLYWFGTTKFLHFLAGYVFAAGILLRLYWAFVGNKYSRWSSFVPVSRKQVTEIVQVTKIEVLQVSNEALDPVGHNALAALTYLGMGVTALFSVSSGFALYAPTSSSWIPHLFSWMVPLFGSEFTLRSFHHGAMWIFVAFTIVHVYLACYEDVVDGHGAVSAMIGGWKFVDKPEKNATPKASATRDVEVSARK